MWWSCGVTNSCLFWLLWSIYTNCVNCLISSFKTNLEEKLMLLLPFRVLHTFSRHVFKFNPLTFVTPRAWTKALSVNNKEATCSTSRHLGFSSKYSNSLKTNIDAIHCQEISCPLGSFLVGIPKFPLFQQRLSKRTIRNWSRQLIVSMASRVAQ